MNNIVRLLPRLLEAAGDHPEFAESIVMVAWSRAVGEGLRLHTSPLGLSGNALVVAVADVAWQRQLQAMSAELLARLNRLLGRNMINFIEFRIEPAKVEKLRAEINKKNKPDLAIESVPTEIMLAAESIKDESLRQHFLYAAAAAVTRANHRNSS